VLYWPDTVFVLDYQVGITEINNGGENLKVFQNYPNPVIDQTTITLYVPEKDKVGVMISDMLGRKVINTERLLERGYHSFRFAPGSGEIFFFTAYWKATSSSIKILTLGNGSRLISLLEYTGSKNTEPQFKRTEATQNFSFSLGDTLLYIGFAKTVNEVNGSDVIEDAPQTNEIYEFEITEGIPCPGTPTVTYEGQVYNTVLIGTQCWLKENLNVGTMIPGSQEMEDNVVIEKYCYDNDPANCDTYGGLYQWYEMMQYTTQQGTQGICPMGWHIPTDDELKILEGTVDSQYPVGDPIWNNAGYRGFDAGLNLKSTSGWCSGGNGNDLFGFTALPGGDRLYSGNFNCLGSNAIHWSSTEVGTSYSWYRNLKYSYDVVFRSFNSIYNGFSVRCVRDY
jgi:uncharacterized protein (TIGR02145 family)